MFNNNKENRKQMEELSNSSTIIGKGTSFKGNLETFGNIRVEGNVTGNVKTKSKVALGESAFIEGNVMAQNAEIAGEVKGILEVTEILILKSTAVVHGDIITSRMIIESGATFNGQCKMGATVKEIEIGHDAEEHERRAEKSA